ncbi:MAG TPA: peptide chain release factor N(5)-glutamine methyltransferase [Fluviicoccus sp.]|nr:peptide chain release factor N(5)-glutamine methyltransferase [Fluviicoccus sp.]
MVTVGDLKASPLWREPLDREALYRLLSRVTGKTPTMLTAFPETALSADQQAAFNALADRYRQGEPLAYILGEQAFWTLNLTVTPDVLIPRPDTESVVEAVLELGQGQLWRVADLGTGSGAIALSLAHEHPEWSVVATDASAAALAVARGNAAALPRCNIDFRPGSWFEPLDGRFHCIVSNPPYIANDDPHMTALAHEPRSALIAPAQGLADIDWLTAHAAQYLHPDGWLVIEHGWQQGEAVRELFRRSGFREVTTGYDYGGNPRYTRGQL